MVNIPCWIRQDLKQQKQCCCVLECGNTSERSSELFSFAIIGEAANVSMSEKEVTNASGVSIFTVNVASDNLFYI